MDIYEDFDFSSPLSLADALDRLRKYPSNPGDGTFYGQVNGNHFKVSHDAGRAKDTSDDPHVSGYILAEGTGCRIFARAQAPEAQEYNAKFGLGALIACVLLIAYVFYDDNGRSGLNTPLDWMRLPQILIQLAILIGMPVAGWRYIKKFRKQGKYELMARFMDFMDAGYKIEAASDKGA